MPADVAIYGFDDSAAALAARPALTTMRQPWQRSSSEMVRLLLDAISGDEPSAVILPTNWSGAQAPEGSAGSQRLWNVGAKHADVLPECQWYRLQW